MRTMPSDVKNPTVSLVSWFYNEFYGIRADSSMFARHQNKSNPKSVCHLFTYDKELDNAVYTPTQVAELIYYLIDQGVDVNDLSIACMPGLLANYLNRKKLEASKVELDRTIKYLRGEKIDDNKQPMRALPSGW